MGVFSSTSWARSPSWPVPASRPWCAAAAHGREPLPATSRSHGLSAGRPRAPMNQARRVLASPVIAAAAAGLTWTLWRGLGLPSGGLPLDAPFRGLWRWVFAVWLPALFPAFTLIHAWLARVAPPRAAPAVAAAIRWDRRSHLALAALPVWLLAWRGAGSWRLALGVFFVTV